jgi:ribosomal protein L31E
MATKKTPKDAAARHKTLTLSLRDGKRASRKNRAKKAVLALRHEIIKHTRAKPTQIRLSEGINHAIWEKSTFNIPSKLTVDLLVEKDMVRAFLTSAKEMDAYNKKKTEAEKTKKKEETKKETAEEKKEEAEKEKEHEEKLAEKKAKEGTARLADLK